ncbi:MAG: carboxypeptidase regulatory-like domain-containing protein [Natrialbaceae archaeon]|nr:carboxypeptidase regulatory-like domain-containing protein [Natrialbaceae archaeon]
MEIEETGQVTTTNASGQYSIDVGFGTYNLTASLAGYDDQTAEVTLVSNETVTQDFTLAAQNGTVSGTITDAQSAAAIDNASVTLETGQSAMTDASGNYTIANVVPGTYNLTADHADYAPNTTSVTVGPNGSVTADLALTPLNGTVTGTITEADTGATIQNATVTLETGQSATTDASGTYTLADVVPGTYNLTADHANYTANTTSVTVGPNQTVTEDLALSAQNGSISGTVTDQDGADLSGATVTIDSTGQSATTDANGTYTIADVAPGSYNLTASLANYSDATATNVTVGPGEAVTDVNLTLVELNGTVSGTVTNSSDGTALANATVEVVGTDQTATTDATGNYTITDVVPGTYDVQAAAPGYVAETQNVTVPANGTATANFALDPAEGTVTGTVLDNSGSPVEDVTIEAGNTSTTTGAAGSYTLGVAFGNYTVTAEKTGYDNDTATVTVNATTTPVTQNFTLVAQNGSISGTATDQDGTALGSVTVTIDSTGQSAMTDANGTYTLANVSPGTYNLTASLANYSDATATNVAVGPGEDVTDVNVTLVAQNGSISGTITDADTGAAIDNASVTLETGQTATTGATGAYTITNVVPGTYNLTADHADYAPNTTSVTVGPNGSVTADLALSAQNGTVSGTITDAQTGAAIDNASVSLETGRTATTDATGAYTIHERRAGHVQPDRGPPRTTRRTRRR